MPVMEGIVAVLSQLDQYGRECVVAYGSRLLSKAERNYCATRKELLAMVTFIRYFRPYLLGHRFQLRTDHGPLKWLYQVKDPEGQVAWWIEKLQEFDFEVIHRRGLRHTNADALSRLPCTQCGMLEGKDKNDTFPILSMQLAGLDLAEVSQKKLENGEWKILIDARKCDIYPPKYKQGGKSTEMRRLWQLWDQLIVHEGLLYRKFLDCKNSSNVQLQLVVPPSLRGKVLAEVHDGVCGGHLGEDKTFQKLKLSYCWPGYWNSIKEWCRTCVPCSNRKSPVPRTERHSKVSL